MSVPSTHTAADLDKARQCISQVPCAIVVQTRSMGLPDNIGAKLAGDIRHLSVVKGVTFGGGIITATINSTGKIPNTPAWTKFYDDLMDTIADKSAHRLAAMSAVKTS